ncbi:CLUMA_CG013724, isoform A [Clunio marinus]|uniref:CLUMA_CG013724, isoform A n=1 Tax=Clunio marinus TaxID=568069 RepID=A0A1J1IJP2_9DIPT|nr:CLUMA_CG013724, isoform A [Clunio marinus]
MQMITWKCGKLSHVDLSLCSVYTQVARLMKILRQQHLEIQIMLRVHRKRISNFLSPSSHVACE